MSRARRDSSGPEREGLLFPETVHELPGRVRLRHHPVRRNPDLARHVEMAIAALAGVRRVHINTLTASILVEFSAPCSPAALRRAIASALMSHPEEEPFRREAEVARGPEPEAWHAMSASDALRLLGSDATLGLTADEARQRLLRHGPNELPAAQPRSLTELVTGQLATLPVALLSVSALLSVATGGLVDAVVILGVVAVNAAIATTTERQAERTILGLRSYTHQPVAVARGGELRKEDPAELVPGDIIVLAPGALVPADARLVTSQDLAVNEAALTGEALPVQKDAKALCPPGAVLSDRRNMVYRGTAVTGGGAIAVVTATGPSTEIGRVQSLLGQLHPPPTPIQRQLGGLERNLVIVNGLVCGGVLLIGLLRGQPLLPLVRSAVSLAVAAIPEGLPAIATTAMAVGVSEMRRRDIHIRKIDAVETLGGVGAVALDKTGTLTGHDMAVAAMHVDGAFLDGPPATAASGQLDTARAMLRCAALCSEVDLVAGRLEGSATEKALVAAALDLGIDVADLRRRWPLRRKALRAEGRKRMSTEHESESGLRLFVKGDPREVLERCALRRTSAGDVPMEAESRQKILAANERMAGLALRVLGMAEGAGGQDLADETGLTWLGLAGMANPLRPGVRETIQVFHDAGIRTIMITGDQSATAYAIAKQLDLGVDSEIRVLEAGAIRGLDPETLAALAGKADVFARVSPTDKLQIVRALQAGGRIVAMTGDGVNDGPALRAADVGIALGASGTDVAREVADIVLGNDQLGGLVEALRLGRASHVNIRKVLHYLLSTNASESMLMALSAVTGLREPLTPLQLLWLNLVTDVFPAIALGLEPPEEGVLRRPPLDPRQAILRPEDFVRLLREASIMTAASLAVYAMAGRNGQPAGPVVFHTLTLSQILHVLMCRSESGGRRTGAERRVTPRLVGAMGLGLGLQVAAQAVPPLRWLLGLAPLAPGSLLLIACGAGSTLLANRLLAGVGGGTPNAPAKEAS